MKLSFIILASLFSLTALSDDIVWNTLFTIDEDKCFVTGNPARPSEVLSPKSWKEYQGNGYYPFTRAEGEKINLPLCTSMIFPGAVSGELFAVANTAVHTSVPPKPGKLRSWKTIVDYKEQLLNLKSVRVSFSPREKIVAWVGYKEAQGMSKNMMIIFDLNKRMRSEQIHIGTGYEGMSGVLLNPQRKEIVVASVDWCAQVKSYDFSGNVARDFPGINAWFKVNNKCLGWSKTWEWNVDFGRNSKTGEFLFHFSSANYEFSPQPKLGKIYVLDLEKDLVVQEIAAE